MEPSVVAGVAAGVIAFAIAAGWIRDSAATGAPVAHRGSLFADPPRTRLQRAVHRAPIALFRLGLGALLGTRFVLLTHTGRRTGVSRRVVLEVVGRDGSGYLVASGYGPRAQWFRNIIAEPHVRFQVGRHRHTGVARPLPPAESGRLLAEYAHRHPRTAATLMRTVGQDVDGSPASYERVGSDPETGVPLVALTPSQA
ncbi:nitroreductase family deazaflavin-dependent oxidoreductase [Pseudonocardia saturnea]